MLGVWGTQQRVLALSREGYGEGKVCLLKFSDRLICGLIAFGALCECPCEIVPSRLLNCESNVNVVNFRK